MSRYKVVVQDFGGSFYFKGGDTWTPRLEDAFDFADPRCAEQFCRQNWSRLCKVQAVDTCLTQRLPSNTQPSAARL